jgi:ketosteroid isomerase-like protein
MRKRAMSRRSLLKGSACVLTATVVMPETIRAQAPTGVNQKNAQIVRKYYAAWETKDWHALEILLANDFTFTSPKDDHIGKAVYKTRCWEPNVNLIEHFDLQEVAANGNAAFVMYVLHVRNGKTIQNIEHFELRDGKVAAVRCYFGQQNSYPAAVTSGQS